MATASMARCEQELVADCTCPVCQELFQHPQRLTACRHILCKKCLKKMTKKTADPMEEAMSEMSFGLGLFGMFQRHQTREKTDSICCPICRKDNDKFEPDENIECLVKVLQTMRSQSRCFGSDSCLTEAAVQCPCCSKRFCQAHYDAQLTALKETGTSLLKDLDSLLSKPDEACSQQLEKLQTVAAESFNLESAIVDLVHQKFENFRQQVAQCQSKLQSPLVEDDSERACLQLDRAALRRLTSNGASGALARMLPDAKTRVQRAKQRWPVRQLALKFEQQSMQDQFAGFFIRYASAETFQSPYNQMPELLTRVKQHNLTMKPWDIGVMSNLDGIVSYKGAIKLRSSVDLSSDSVKELKGPLLVINPQGFPSKMLHVTDMDQVKQVATITPDFGDEGMPGRIHIYNQRQLILTSDATRHRVSVFNFEGGRVVSFGEKGSEPRQFHEPLGLSAFDNQMFVVDAKNHRVQVFDMDNDYNCLATIRHDEFTDGIQSVLATSSSVFVVDREKGRLSVFDRVTRHPSCQTLKLEAKPFDVVSDEHGNAMVTLVKDGKLLVVNKLGLVLKKFSFKETNEGRQMQVLDSPLSLMMMPMLQMSGGGPPRMFHGAAFDQNSRRLYVADLMRSCVVVTEF